MNSMFLSLKKLDDGSPAWDLALNASGNIILATGSYAVAQNIATAARTFLGECWYDTTKGVPYSQQILGQMPSYQFMKARFVAAALTIRGVASAQCFLTGPGRVARTIGGQIQARLTNGTIVVVTSPEIGVAPWYAQAVNVYAL